MLKVIGIIVVVWIALVAIGALLDGLFWLLVIGAVATVGVLGYRAITRRSVRGGSADRERLS